MNNNYKESVDRCSLRYSLSAAATPSFLKFHTTQTSHGQLNYPKKLEKSSNYKAGVYSMHYWSP